MKKLVVSLALLALFASACSNSADTSAESADEPTKEKVLAAFYPLAEMAQRIGGDAVTVDDLTPPGTEPHDLELSPEQVVDVRDAKLVFFVGGGFAPAVESVAKERTANTVDVAQGLTLDKAEEHGEEDGHSHAGEEAGAHEGEEEAGINGNDPHFWLDPVLMSDATKSVEEGLIAAMPEKADQFRANANAYRGELQTLDVDFRQGLSNCQTNTIVTGHAAFHYMAKRYNFQQEPISLSPDAEPDPKQLDKLTDVITENKVTTVFSETLVSPRVAETLAREAGVKTATLNPLEGLTDEELAQNATYNSVMRQNLAALRDARVCS